MKVTTEKNMWDKLRPWLNAYGIAIRIENGVGEGLPDVLFISGGRVIFIELKVLHGNRIILRRFQYAMATRVRHHIENKNYIFAVDTGEDISLFTFEQIRGLSVNPLANESISIDLSTTVPFVTLDAMDDVLYFLEMT